MVATVKKRTVRADDYLRSVFAGRASLLFDGAMGTELQRRGLGRGAAPEFWCLTHPDKVSEVHRAYVEAGSDVVTTNTFGANARKLREMAALEGRVAAPTVTSVFEAAVRCARAAHPRYVAADIGPIGELMKPLGTLGFDEAYELFREQVVAAEAAGADLIIIETMSDLAEARCATLAAKENTSLPICVTMTFGEDGRTFLGTTPEVAATVLSTLGADLVGINCSLGPAEVAPLAKRMCEYARVGVMVQANAGLPRVEAGLTVYDVSPDDYVRAVEPMVEFGVRVLGGCCGTTPEYIRRLRELLGRVMEPAAPMIHEDAFCVCSERTLIALEPAEIAVVGERINPTGKRLMKEALRSGDADYIIGEAIAQERAGADILDVNVGLPEIDERHWLVRLATELGQLSSCPLQIDSSDADAVEAAVRVYPGRAIINSCNGSAGSLERVMGIAAHYGCCIVGLTLDEQGIPSTAEGRLAIARRIVEAAEACDLRRQDVLIDCLTMAVSADADAARCVLDTMRLVKRELPGVRLTLGVSNVSFGLPNRDLLGSVFLASAFSAGLDVAIINPLSTRFSDTVDAWRALTGQDASQANYIERNAGRNDVPTRPATQPSQTQPGPSEPHGIRDAVLMGRPIDVGECVRRLVANGLDPLSVVSEHLIPALDEVGSRYERKEFFLPQLMAAADAARAGFDEVSRLSSTETTRTLGEVVLATVEGDIHDIGKNIVRMLLENYGYRVYDLGRDVSAERIVDEVVLHHVRLVGLSALMTTTVPAMESAIALLRERAPWCKVVVGGAVLNEEYARMVGADYYARDANEAIRIAHEVFAQDAGER